MPHCFSRRYTDVCDNVTGYKIEELGNLIWLGGVIAEHGPFSFQELWRPLRKALQHYIYGFEHQHAIDLETGHRALYEYAERLDQLLAMGKV